MKVQFYKPFLGEEEKNAATRVLDSGILTMGKEVYQLEEEFAAYVGSKYAVAVDSCTSGLFLSVFYAGGTSINIPALTFCSVANSILHANKKVSFRDIYYVGHAYELEGSNLLQIYDSAHELHRGCYKKGSLQCFSFYPTKLIGSCEGGMIATDNKDFVDWAQIMRSHGKVGSNWDYKVVLPGYKLNMTDMQAAIAREQLKKLDLANQDRKSIMDRYNKNLKEHATSLHLYRVSVPKRDEFLEYMKSIGIDCSVHFAKPLTVQPAYKNMASHQCLGAELEANRTISLPFYPELEDMNVDKISEEVINWRIKHSSQQ